MPDLAALKLDALGLQQRPLAAYLDGLGILREEWFTLGRIKDLFLCPTLK